jgi:hypothetical protein
MTINSIPARTVSAGMKNAKRAKQIQSLAGGVTYLMQVACNENVRDRCEPYSWDVDNQEVERDNVS